MNHIGQDVRRVYSHSKSNSQKASIAIEEKLSVAEVDNVLDSYPELIDPKYRGWAVIQLKAKGKRKFIELADRAMRYGNNRQKLFVHLLK